MSDTLDLRHFPSPGRSFPIKPQTPADTRYSAPSQIHLINMGFGDLKSDSGLSVLNGFLADKSYIEGLVNNLIYFSI